MSTKINLSHSGAETIIEYETLSSGRSDYEERPERLHEWLKLEQLELLQQKILAHPQQSFNVGELKHELSLMNIEFTDREFNRLFLKINQNRDFRCDWNELVSYLIFGFQEDDPSSQKEALILPISVPPLIKKSEHRSPICAISLITTIIEDEAKLQEDEDLKGNVSTDDLDETGIYLTASREGQIRFWSPQLEPLKTGMSESIHLNMPTWILAIQALPDVSIVCTASTERELRFHETVVSTFSLRVVIRSLPFAICVMSYSAHIDGRTPSKLCLGDYGGNVRILEFTPYLRGPFQSKPGAALIDLYWTDVMKGKMPSFKAREYLNIHTEIIQQVLFSLPMNSLFMAAEYRNTKKYRGRCPGLIVTTGEEKTTFRIPLGVTTFYVDTRNNIVVTGGPDTFVRIWDIYIFSKPMGICSGHNGGIVKVFIQPDEKKVYSVDYQKIIKVWHLTEYTLLQTYGDLARLIPAENDLVYFYHKQSRELVVGGRRFIKLKCAPRVRVDLTDGNTHAAPISVVLYNRLFRNVVTCGLDSFIIVWDPYTGHRKIIMKNCHTKQVYGETIDIEITAACFDPLEQFLLTGARDGSLKVWNYNNAVCIRNMSITSEHEVTAVIWVVERILAVGWDQQVTEFNDVEGREYGDPKKWIRFHSDDITCADVKLGEGVVTATYSGEIIFWKLETGQPYRRYNVTDPTKFIELKYNKPVDDEKIQAKERNTTRDTRALSFAHFIRKSISENIRSIENKFIPTTRHFQKSTISLDDEEFMSDTSLGEGARTIVLPISVQAVLFLQTRPMTREHGSVFVSLDTGIIQVYSHHQRGGYISEFNSVHKTGDCVLCMSTDRKNRFLFTGTAFGYIKIWLIQNYCIPEEEKKKVVMPLLRLQFIFLRKERFLTRAKRVVRHQLEPMLVSSYKGHLKAINSIVYINLSKVLMSGSHDCSCRLWSLGGRYLGTLGTPLPWMKLSPFYAVDEDMEYRMPPDIKKVGSSTTMKVISGVQAERVKTFNKDNMEEEIAEDDESIRYFGKPLREPILGKHFNLPGKSAIEQRCNLDISLSYIPVFTNLKTHEANHIRIPPTPPVIRRMAQENYMDFYTNQNRGDTSGVLNLPTPTTTPLTGNLRKSSRTKEALPEEQVPRTKSVQVTTKNLND